MSPLRIQTERRRTNTCFIASALNNISADFEPTVEGFVSFLHDKRNTGLYTVNCFCKTEIRQDSSRTHVSFCVCVLVRYEYGCPEFCSPSALSLNQNGQKPRQKSLRCSQANVLNLFDTRKTQDFSLNTELASK